MTAVSRECVPATERRDVSPYPHDHAPLGQSCPACDWWEAEGRYEVEALDAEANGTMDRGTDA